MDNPEFLQAQIEEANAVIMMLRQRTVDLNLAVKARDQRILELEEATTTT